MFIYIYIIYYKKSSYSSSSNFGFFRPPRDMYRETKINHFFFFLSRVRCYARRENKNAEAFASLSKRGKKRESSKVSSFLFSLVSKRGRRKTIERERGREREKKGRQKACGYVGFVKKRLFQKRLITLGNLNLSQESVCGYLGFVKKRDFFLLQE